MGYYVAFNGILQFTSPPAAMEALTAINSRLCAVYGDQHYACAWSHCDSLADALSEAFGAEDVNVGGDLDYSICGYNKHTDSINEVLAALIPYVTTGSGVEFVGEDDAFWEEVFVNGRLVAREGVRTYVDERRGRTGEYLQGADDTLAATYRVLASHIPDDTPPLMQAIRTALTRKETV